MSVVKIKILKGFTILTNSVLENPRLSFKAKGLWAYCMSRKDDWEFHVSHLATVSKEKEKSIYAALEELVLEGLVTRIQNNVGKGKGKGRGSFGKVEYTIYPTPQPVSEEIKKIITLRRFARAQKDALISTDPNKKGTPPLPPPSAARKSEESSSSKKPPTEEDDYLKKRLKKLMGKNAPADKEYQESRKRLQEQILWRKEKGKDEIGNPAKWMEADILYRRALLQADDVEEEKWGGNAPDLDENGVNRNIKVTLPEGS